MNILDKLVVKNFMSHNDSEFIFKNNVLTLILGQNEDDSLDGANSNGSGKSVIVEGITTALTGETYREITKDEFIKDGEDTAEVKLWMHNNHLQRNIMIEWFFKRGKSAKCDIYLNDDKEPLKQIISVAEAKEFILNELGISREDLLNYFIINQGNNNSFFTSGDAKQKEIISRLTNFKIVEDVVAKFQSELKSLVNEKNVLNTDISTQEGVKQSLKELIDEETNAIDCDETVDKVTIKKEIKELEIKIVGVGSNIEDEKSELVKIDGVIKKIDEDIVEYEDLLLSKVTVEEEIEKDQDTIDTNNKSIRKYNQILDGKITCPECKAEFLLKNELTTPQIKIEVSKLEKQNIKKQADIDSNNDILKTFEETETLLASIREEKRVEKRKRSTVSESIEDLQSQLNQLKRKKTNKESEIDEIKADKVKESKIPTYEAKIKVCDSEIQRIQTLLDANQLEIDDKNHWILHLGRKGFCTFLTNKIIGVVQNITNKFLKDVKSNLRVKINGFQILKSGELREKISIQIIKDGEDGGSFNKFSGGQRERIVICGILAMQSLINNSTDGKGLNLLCLDESTDFLDKKGQQAILKTLQNIDSTILTISHNDIENLIHDFNVVKVVYKNKNSKILNNE